MQLGTPEGSLRVNQSSSENTSSLAEGQHSEVVFKQKPRRKLIFSNTNIETGQNINKVRVQINDQHY
jgi:hypothetical protein